MVPDCLNTDWITSINDRLMKVFQATKREEFDTAPENDSNGLRIFWGEMSWIASDKGSVKIKNSLPIRASN